MKGFLALFFLLLFCVDFTKSASCVALAKKLTVSYGTSCDLTSSLTGLDEVSISGTVNVQGLPGSTPLSLEATNIYVYSTGRILADGYGYGPMNGPGKGSSGGSGGSHGGRGGMNSGTFLKSNEAVSYGGIEKPSAFGSGGGCSTGGKGGGVITLKAIDNFQVDGLVSANGNPDGSNCGGGSGGSIYVDTDYFKGSGMVTARGGTGNGTGGGGGGGRISIVHRVSATFSGDIFADGGESSTDVNQLTLQSTTASSARYTAASYGDMTKHSTNSWRAYYFNTDQWLQATLSSPKWITRVATRGHQSYNMWVKKYKIQYYNDTSTAWVTLSYPSDGFSGNTDNNGIVPNDLFAPIYTSKIRFYPQTWNTGISMSVKLYGYNNYDTVSVSPTTCSSTTSAGPGGPGTIFLAQTGAGVGTVVIDARGKDPKVKKINSCDQFDAASSGAVAWIKDDSFSLDEIVLTFGAHLVLSNYTSVSQILSDGKNNSVVHVLPKATLKLGNTLTVPCFVYSEGLLVPASGTTIYFEEWLYIMGNITFSNDESIIVNGNLTMEIQNFTTVDLKIGTTGIMTMIPLTGGSIFPLDTEKFSVYGTFKCDIINITRIQEFTVGANGVVDMVPVTIDMHLGKKIHIAGSVNLHHELSILHPCESFEITGSKSKLVWDKEANITLECLFVYINGFFKPGTINFGSGVETLRIGYYGDFEFKADGPVLTNSFWADGTTKINNAAEFKSLNRSDLRIEVFVVDESGHLYLNHDSSPKIVSGAQVATTYNNIRARYLVVNGYLNATLLSTDPGVDKVTVGKDGTFLFTPYDEFLVHEIEVNGLMNSHTPVIFRGQRLAKVENLTVGESGTMILDNNAQETKSWSGVSEMPFHYVYVNGHLKAGKILNRYINETDEGWNYMYIHNSSSIFEFETEYPFLIETADINGTFISYKPVAITAPSSSSKRLVIFIGFGGHMTLDSDSSHPIGPFASNSSINAENLVMDTGSLLEAGDTHFDIDTVEISGSINARPKSKVEIRSFTVTNMGKVNITTPIILESLTVNVAGLLDIDFRRMPDNTNSGNAASDILVTDNILISGTLQAGSLYIETDKMTVSGTLDVSGGGYLNSKGTGGGLGSSSGASGGSYGGRGGRGSVAIAAMPHGSIYTEGTWGSGGGRAGSTLGGRGGGRLHLKINTQLTLEGTMKTNGDDATVTNAGGGSGGSLYVQCLTLSMSGYIYCNGGSGLGNGGGGSGGRINFFFNYGTYESGHVISKGGSGYEPGGPGIMYFQGKTCRNLRVDNKCQKPMVTEPSGTTADISHFNIYKSTEPTTDSVRWNLTSATERHDVSCLSDSISVFIPSDLLSHYQTTWRDPHCQVQDNGTHYVSTISHTSCGTTVIFTKDEVIFENELILHKSGSPSNQTSKDSIDFGSSSSEVIPVQCIYPRRQNITTLYRPAQSKVRFYEKRYGHMDVQLEQYRSGMFVTPLPVRSFPNEVEINKDMYFILHAMHVNSTDVAVKVDSCVATPTNMPADGRIYQLLDQGCPASPAVKVYPSSFDEVRFSVRAFEFRTSPGGIVYIHCQVSVCSPTSPQCRVGCAHRHRREVSTEDGGSHLVSGGPYLLVADKGGLQVSTVVAGVCASVAVVATVIAIIGWRRKSSASTSSSKL